MKKRVLCLILCLSFVFMLVGCGGSGTVTITNDPKAVTITISMIKNESTTDEAVAAVQASLNEITESLYNTHVVLQMFTKDEYDQKVLELNAAIGEGNVGDNDIVTNDGATYVHKGNGDIQVVDEYGRKKTVYPTVSGNQLDILLIDNLSLYNKMADVENDAYLTPIGNDLMEDNAPLIEKYVNNKALDQVKRIADYTSSAYTYAYPNNMVYGTYQYMLVNKALFDKYNYDVDMFKPTGEPDYFVYFDQIEQFVNDVVKNESGVTPVYNFTGFHWLNYLGENSVLVLKPGQDFKKSTAPTPSNIFNISTFKNTMNMLHNLKEMGYTYLDTDKVDFNTKFAVAFMPGDTTVPKDLKDDYYVVTLQKPYIDNTMFESMYGISAFSQYPDRCLQILQLFNTNPDFVNTLAYGVKDTHYELDENKMVVNRSDDWSIDTKYAGNNFLLYQNEDMTEQELAYSANNWELGKLQNNAAFITPFCGFELKHDTDKDHLDESGNPLKNADGKVIEYMLVDDILKGLDEYSKEIFTKLENYDENCVDPETGKKLSYMEYMKLLYDESGQNEFKKLAVPDKASENEFTPADQYAAWFIKYYYVFG